MFTHKLLGLFIDSSLAIKPLKLSDSNRYFDLVEKNRTWLSQYGDETAGKYPTKNAVECSIIYPNNPEKRRFGIWSYGQFAGTINLTPLDEDTVAIGYWLGKEFTREGIMTKAVKCITGYALEDLGYKSVVAHVDPGNRRSCAVLERAGFKQVDNERRCDITYIMKKPPAGYKSFTYD